MSLVERLAAKRDELLAGSTWMAEAGEDEARWWLNAIADELEANQDIYGDDELSQAVSWLREQASLPEPPESA